MWLAEDDIYVTQSEGRLRKVYRRDYAKDWQKKYDFMPLTLADVTSVAMFFIARGTSGS